MEKELLIKRIIKIDDKLFVSRILDKAAKAENSGSIINSDFIDPYQKRVIMNVLSGCRDINYIFSGGYTGAEREIVIFGPDFISVEEMSTPERFFKLIHMKLVGRGNLTHRDYLGSLMGIGIKREKIGDILNNEDYCSIIVLTEVAEFIRYNINRIGNVKVNVEIRDIGEVKTFEQKVELISATVASLRLDSIASAGFGISRSKISDYIKAERLNLNWEAVSSPSKQVREGDTISIRGKGRVVVEKVGGLTRKGRTSVLIKKLI